MPGSSGMIYLNKIKLSAENTIPVQLSFKKWRRNQEFLKYTIDEVIITGPNLEKNGKESHSS